ncbi:MAG TPA: ABC transporter ATP-binding protein, partial [Pirellulales bacterium]
SAPAKTTSAEPKKRKLTYKERQERDSLPTKIEKIEAEVGDVHAEMAKPEFYQQAGDRIAQAGARLKTLEEQLAAAYARWEELEQIPE